MKSVLKTGATEKKLDFYRKSVILLIVMRKTTEKIKWLVSDLGLNELNAWLWMIGGAALTALGLVLLSGGGAEILRFWRVFFLKLF